MAPPPPASSPAPLRDGSAPGAAAARPSRTARADEPAPSRRSRVLGARLLTGSMGGVAMLAVVLMALPLGVGAASQTTAAGGAALTPQGDLIKPQEPTVVAASHNSQSGQDEKVADPSAQTSSAALNAADVTRTAVSELPRVSGDTSLVTAQSPPPSPTPKQPPPPTNANSYCWPYQCSFYDASRLDGILNGWSWENNKFIIFFISGCGGLLLLTLLLWLVMYFFGTAATGPEVPQDGYPVNYELTLRTFMIRRLERTHQGTREPVRLWLAFVILAFLAVVLGLVSVSQRSITFNIGLGGGSTFTLIGFVLLLWASYLVARIVRWVLYWLVLGAIILVFVDGHPSIHFSDEDNDTFRNVVCSFIMLMETLTIIIWIIERKLYVLSIQKDYSLMKPLNYRLRIQTTALPPVPSEVAQSAGYESKERVRIRFYYQQPGEWPWRWLGGTIKRVASYDGFVDDQGRPHGYGTWQDSAARGENLRGIFRHGRPCGPFHSSETETGHGFSMVHIGFVHNRKEKWDEKYWKPRLSDVGLQWGIAAVEACFAGGFFKHLPHSELFVRPTTTEEGGSAYACASRLAQLPMRGEAPSKPGEPFEAVLYVHGFASTLQEATLPFGQLLALAALPSHFKPFIFSWPCGHYLTYFQAKHMAMSAEVAQDLAAVLQSLEDAGATAVHIIAYSLGAQLLFSALPEISSKLVPCANAPHKPGSQLSKDASWICAPPQTKAKLKMATCMLMSPDFPLEEFVNDTYYSLRSVCDTITLYADEQDVALAIGEFFSHVKGLSRYPFSLVTSQSSSKSGDEEENILPPMPFERAKLEETALDVDVINTSFLDDNVPQLRHINLPSNVHVVDDLREIIVGRLRASQRRRTSRMIRIGRAANVYSFMAAPGHVAKDAAT